MVTKSEFKFQLGEKVAVRTSKCGLSYPDNITIITEQVCAVSYGPSWYRIEDCDDLVREDWLEPVKE